MPTIYPTGKCFDDALEFVENLLRREEFRTVLPVRLRVERLLVCHGILHAKNGIGDLMDGKPYAHAWVEDGECVWHSGMLEGERVYCQFDRAGWYAEHNITDVTRYTLAEVWEHNQKHRTYGPWEERYLKLCRVEARHQ